MEGTTVLKQINRFEDYRRRQKTSMAAIQKAYEAADRAASAASHAGKPQYLVSCVSLPHMGRRKEYQVRTQPCGYLTSVSTEQVNLIMCQLDLKHLTGLLQSKLLLHWA